MRLILSLLLFGAVQCAADPFINLTFDQPDLSGPLIPLQPGGPYEGNTDQLLRGWTVTIDGLSRSRVVFSPPQTGIGGPVNLMNRRPLDTTSPLGPYSLELFSQFPAQPDIRLSQTATMPDDATFLWIASIGYIQAYADGAKIGEVNPVFGTWAFLSVAPYAGKEVTLEFALPPGGAAEFDIIGFTTIPEPSTWALLGFGLVVVVWQLRRQL
ncbi:MAG TPA: PEP-CTERM sorting domain-containing protein [Verrucomicrobiota bacterium]|nr:hypothetical protein [Verrucomicrobiales bacterium]HRI16498.1 PEP-CTERM sorting domain-containing protein [Verrucomicrobiota bacterium]